MTYAIDTLPHPIREIHDFGILHPVDIYLAETLNRRMCGGKASPRTLLACCLASRLIADGHMCLQLDGLSPAGLVALGPGESLTPDALSPDTVDLCKQLTQADTGELEREGHGLIGGGDGGAPVVISNRRVYLRRYWKYEAQVAERLRAMNQVDPVALPSDDVAAVMTDLGLHGRQRDAALTALQRRFTVISGGPGTGKTYVAVRILALLLHAASQRGRVPIVRLAAPTGKAAARLDESVREAMAKTAGAAGELAEFVAGACTIDRLLGYVPNSPYFKHTKDHLLPADVVLIDEASMVDLPKMAKLLDALDPTSCRLVLLGDMHQLASVDPGSVMADICLSDRLRDSVVELTESRRFPADSPVGRLSRAVNTARTREDGAATWTLLQGFGDGAFGEHRIRIHAPGPAAGRGVTADPGFAAAVLRGYAAFLQTKTPGDAFDALEHFRILCALRGGPEGVTAVNHAIEQILSGRGVDPDGLPPDLRQWPRLHPDSEFYDHRVVMITRNDYAIGLFNGDVGIVLPDEQDPERMTVCFAAGKEGDPPRRVPCRLLPEHETAFAMTVHKSQGSQFGSVLVLLPVRFSPVLTRELLYTAITRTRTGVDLWCSRKVFVQAMVTGVQRSTGLPQQLNA